MRVAIKHDPLLPVVSSFPLIVRPLSVAGRSMLLHPLHGILFCHKFNLHHPSLSSVLDLKLFFFVARFLTSLFDFRFPYW
jgi:hypothetical protein